MDKRTEELKLIWIVSREDEFTHPFESWCVHNREDVPKTIARDIRNEKDANRIADCLNACGGMDIPFNVIVRTKQRLAIVVNKIKSIGSIDHGLDSDAMHRAIDELLEDQKKFDEKWPND